MTTPRSSPEQTQDEGIDLALEQLCTFLGVDPHMVSWDAATETVDGDIRAVIGNIMRAKYGEDFDPKVGRWCPQDTTVEENEVDNEYVKDNGQFGAGA